MNFNPEFDHQTGTEAAATSTPPSKQEGSTVKDEEMAEVLKKRKPEKEKFVPLRQWKKQRG